MEMISTSNAPLPGGHYSQAIIFNDMVFVSGQLPIDPADGLRELGPIEKQTEQVLKNIEAILIASGSDREHVIRTTVYIADINLWEYVNTVYANFFGYHRPVRTVVPSPGLHFGSLIEIDAIAAVINHPE